MTLLFESERESRLAGLAWRAHRRFMRRSNRSIAMFPQDHERLHQLAVEAAALAMSIRAAYRR